MADQSNAHEENHGHQTYDVSNAEGRMNWVLYDFWPIMFYVVVFLLMIALPLTLSGMMRNPFSAADVVWPGYGLLIVAEFVLALVIFILAPKLVMPFMLLLSIYSLIFAEQGRAWIVGNTPWGSSIAILFLTYVLVGWYVLFQGNRSEMRDAKRRL